MAGFFGLFGRRTKYVDDVEAQINGKEDFFLSPDDAKTFGDIDYMRKSNKVRHTFPGNVNNGGSFAVEKEVNAMEEKAIGDRPTPATSATSTTPATPTNETSRRRASSFDDNMNTFRQMAKSMKR